MTMNPEIVNKIRFYIKLNRFESAEKLLLSTLSSNFHGKSELHFLLGIVYHQQSRFDEAMDEFNQALSFDEQNIEARLCLIVTLCDLGRYEEARQLQSANLTKASTNSKYSHMHFYIAKQHYQNGKSYEQKSLFSEALIEYRKAINLDESYWQAQLAMGRVLFRTKQFELAQLEFEKILTKDANNSLARVWLGLCFKAHNKNEEANQEWERAKMIDSDSALTNIYWDIMVEAGNRG